MYFELVKDQKFNAMTPNKKKNATKATLHSIFKQNPIATTALINIYDHYTTLQGGTATERKNAAIKWGIQPANKPQVGYGKTMTKKTQYKRGGNKNIRMSRLKQLLSEL